jgi:cystathionine gamma-synthase
METKAVHAAPGVDPATGAVTLPIHLSTTFERDADGGYPRGYEYARESNPNRDALEECVRELEGGAGDRRPREPAEALGRARTPR